MSPPGTSLTLFSGRATRSPMCILAPKTLASPVPQRDTGRTLLASPGNAVCGVSWSGALHRPANRSLAGTRSASTDSRGGSHICALKRECRGALSRTQRACPAGARQQLRAVTPSAARRRLTRINSGFHRMLEGMHLRRCRKQPVRALLRAPGRFGDGQVTGQTSKGVPTHRPDGSKPSR